MVGAPGIGPARTRKRTVESVPGGISAICVSSPTASNPFPSSSSTLTFAAFSPRSVRLLATIAVTSNSSPGVAKYGACGRVTK